MTIDQQEATGTTRANGAHQGPAGVPLPGRDVRRKRPPVLLFLLRLETLRRVVRVVSLLILDFIGVAGALMTALAVKIWIQGDHFSFSIVWDQTRHWLAFAYLITVLMFARVDLYADRTRRPGFAQIGTALFQATIIALVFALANGEHFSSYYIFYSSLFFGTIYITALRELHLRTTGWLLEQAGYQRRALLVGSGKHIEAVAHALANRARTQVLIVGYISLQPRPQNGLRSLGKLDDLSDVLDHERVQEVIIADPDFPQDKAVELVDLCHQSGVSVHVAPSTMEILIDRAEFVPGQTVPLFTLRPPVFEGIDYALKRTFDLMFATVGLILLSPVLLAIAIAVKLSSRGPVIYRSVRPGHGLQAVRLLQVPHHARPRRSDPGRPRAAQRAVGRAVQDPPGPAAHDRRALPAPLLAGRASPAAQRRPGRDVAWSGRGRCRCATSGGSRSGTRSATSSCRGSPASGRSPAAPSSTSTTSSASISSTSSGGRSCSTSRSC